MIVIIVYVLVKSPISTSDNAFIKYIFYKNKIKILYSLYCILGLKPFLILNIIII